MRLQKQNNKPKGDPMKDIMAGIDLHSNNLMLALVDRKGQRLFHKKVDCDLNGVEQALSPYRKRIDTIAVESTFNWYWLVDSLQDFEYKTVLANPLAFSNTRASSIPMISMMPIGSRRCFD